MLPKLSHMEWLKNVRLANWQKIEVLQPEKLPDQLYNL